MISIPSKSSLAVAYSNGESESSGKQTLSEGNIAAKNIEIVPRLKKAAGKK